VYKCERRRMEELEVSSPMEEDEVRRSVRGTSDCDLRFWGNHGNSNYNHALGCRPSTSGHDRVDSTSGIANGTIFFPFTSLAKSLSISLQGL
jgi:hypothetical protein